jgi:hypothetical protein
MVPGGYLPIKNEYDRRQRLSMVVISTEEFAMRSIIS